MADDINIDPALSQPPSSVVSDLTPLASPALSPFSTPAPSSLRHSRHASPDIAVPSSEAATPSSASQAQVNGSHDTAANSSTHNGNHSNSHADDISVPQLSEQGTAQPPLPPKPPVQQAMTAGVKRKADDSNIMKCPYRESKKCKKEYKHKNAMRYHLEQAHHQEPDIQSHLSQYPALPPSKKAKLLNSRLASGSHSSNASTSNNNKSSSLSSIYRNTVTTSSAAASAPNPFFGLFTHGYVFSSAGLPFRPHERPIDALYYLNILSTAGIKSQQQRASERLMINALLNADFIKHLQESVNTDYQRLDLLNAENGMVKPPILPIQPSTSNNYSPYTKRDADSAVLKLAKTLQDVGLGDGIDNAQYF
ncbi:hypothetical protein P389DRAFT_165397 [Cystobasidium minutum MCA 4210]|uniref:uncharacterized protein n=1 Tax=Cystobasidium minutum MCA 4210 TaxID=1397322 RepID=UPI0034CE948A|eukprot:jgi/Rhomi1/165397/fgenesh1_kg.1_\